MAAVPLTQGGPPDGGNYEYSWEGSYIRTHFLSDIGKKRPHNEDFCILCVPEKVALLEKRGMLFAVADGMGGASSGEFASRLALKTIVEGYFLGPGGNIPLRLREAIEEANRRVFEESLKDAHRHGMGTTVSVLLIHGDCAYVAQVGDSRVYVRRGDTNVLQVTDDHSLVAEQVREGYLSEEEARNHTLKNLITRAVGIKETVKVDLFAFQIRRDDTLLICSDGLSNLVADEEISDAMALDGLQGAARKLIGIALRAGGVDNITAALIRVMSDPPHVEREPGAQEIILPKSGLFGRIRGFLRGSR